MLMWVGTVNAQVAQSVEQRIENPRVGGSIPPLGTIYKKASRQRGFFVYGVRGLDESTDLVRPIAPAISNERAARSPQGTNSPEAV